MLSLFMSRNCLQVMVDRSTFWACAGVAAASMAAVTMALKVFTVLTLSGRNSTRRYSGPESASKAFNDIKIETNWSQSRDLRGRPVRPDRPGHAVERAFANLPHQTSRRIHRSRHRGYALGYPLEAEPAVIGLVTHQHDQAVAVRF